MSKKVWIDDERAPEDFLSAAECEGIVWIKKIREAIRYIKEHAEEIEVMYLDYYMDDLYLDGSELVFEVLHGRKEGSFANLKTVYLHSSDETAIDDMMEYADEIKALGVDMLPAPYRK